MAIDYADVVKLYPDSVLILPDAVETDNKGEVIAISDETDQCMVGDVVVFPKDMWVEVKVGAVEHYVMKGSDICAWISRVDRPPVTYP